MKKQHNIAWFSIIEVLIGIFIFTLGLISIYTIMSSSLRINDYNKNEIIASNLAREQIELLRNVRDSNYKTLNAWDWIPNTLVDDTQRFAQKFSTWSYYTIENDWDATPYPIEINLLWEDSTGLNPIPEWISELAPSWWMVDYRLCLNSENEYVTCSSGWETPFYRYLTFEEISGKDAMIAVSKVIWYKRWYHELEIRTVIADWKRL